MKHRRSLLWLLRIVGLLLLFRCAAPASAGERPSFTFPAWHATDVVVVEEGEQIDGKCTVIEAWKGDLKTGDSVFIPELASFEPESTRAIDSWYTRLLPGSPKYVTGTRMVLFLKRSEGTPGEWQPADVKNGMKVSVVWIEHGDTYAFVQVKNPGPSTLVPLRKVFDPVGSEEEMKALASNMIRTQTALDRVSTINNPAQRAQALRPFVDSPHVVAWHEAFAELSKCGEAAIPLLRAILADNTLLPRHEAAVKALGEIGGARAGAELTSLVERETEFWKQTAPSLKLGWWNDPALEWSQLAILRDHYSRLLEAVYALRRVKYNGSKDAVIDLRDFWRSLPQLQGKSGSSQMSEACDNVLRALSGIA